MKWLFSVLLLISFSAFAQSSQQCLSWMIWKEARGEGILTQRAVMDVANNRARTSGKNICDVLRADGQYPYAIDGVGSVPKYFLQHMQFLYMMEPVMPKNVFYFNSVRPEYGVRYMKLGGLYFNREK